MPHVPVWRTLLLALTLAGAAPPPAPNPPPDAQDAAAARLNAIKADVEAAKAALHEAWGKQTDSWPMSEAVARLYEVYEQKRHAGRGAAFAVAQANPASDAGFAALEYVLSDAQLYGDPVGKAALELMARHHAENPKVAKTVANLGYFPPHPKNRSHPAAVALLTAVAQRNPDRAARGQAALGLAFQAKWACEIALLAAEQGAGGVAGADRRAAEAERAFESVAREYGDVPNLLARPDVRAATLREEAESELYELRHLRVGKPAPEIEGEDLAGRTFKLSDARGKVVLLVFWASWCGPCMADVPHEKELVERFRGRPFELIGVCGDGDKDKAARAIDKAQIPWRSFWNGPADGAGPISKAWNLRGWPTVYAIDHRGVLRTKELRGKDLDAPLEKLVAEAEAANTAPR